MLLGLFKEFVIYLGFLVGAISLSVMMGREIYQKKYTRFDALIGAMSLGMALYFFNVLTLSSYPIYIGVITIVLTSSILTFVFFKIASL